MQNKQKSRLKILWYILPILAAFALSIIIIPPMINLNFLKDKIENIILSKTNIPIKINGNINISLLGRATIVAHNINIPNGVISSCEFAIPLSNIFDINNAKISDDITINGASFIIDKIIPYNINTPIVLNNSKMHFLNKEYKIINANLSKNDVHAIIRTDQHKYEINSKNNNFIIKNKNNNLILTGELFPDGTANANISIIAQDVNKWFEFEKPRITGQFPVRAEMTWNGSYGVNFKNISAKNVSGNVYFQEDGYKIIELKSQSADYDLTFFTKNPDIFKNMTLDIDLYGKLKFMNNVFKHVKINTIGNSKQIQIKNIIADDLSIHGGTIDEFGAHNVNVSLIQNNKKTTCLFNGTPTQWSCEKFVYDDTIYGKLNVNTNEFFADIKSDKTIQNIKKIIKSTKTLGNRGIIKFDFPDMSGKIVINQDKYNIEYKHLDDKSLIDTDINLSFLPEFMQNEHGNFVWDKKTIIFIPSSKTWRLFIDDDLFIIHGDNIKNLFPNIDLQSLRDMKYTLSGNYKNTNISNLMLEIENHKFTGSASEKSITLKTDFLNIDDFTDSKFKQNFEELSFFAQLPIITFFDLPVNIALSANTLIYNNQRYNNFLYSLHKNIQTFSISDSDRGNLLATITKNNAKYDINIQLNKFVFDEKLLPEYMPLNLSDTTVTAEIKLKTNGNIAHDLIYNINGTFDASFDGGKLYGIGLDNFYAFAPKITTLNAEEILTKSLSGGITQIKKMRIIGTYNNGNIKTTYPLNLSMKHVDANGTFEIINNQMFAQLNMILRGTSAGPEPIDLIIHPDNRRDFSLSEIMMNFDPEYMRTFTQTHNKF